MCDAYVVGKSLLLNFIHSMDCVKGMISKVPLNMQVIMKPLSGLSDPPPSPLQAVKVVFLQHTLDNILCC